MLRTLTLVIKNGWFKNRRPEMSRWHMIAWVAGPAGPSYPFITMGMLSYRVGIPKNFTSSIAHWVFMKR